MLSLCVHVCVTVCGLLDTQILTYFFFKIGSSSVREIPCWNCWVQLCHEVSLWLHWGAFEFLQMWKTRYLKGNDLISVVREDFKPKQRGSHTDMLLACNECNCLNIEYSSKLSHFVSRFQARTQAYMLSIKEIQCSQLAWVLRGRP